jgi:hypothetical protein
VTLALVEITGTGRAPKLSVDGTLATVEIVKTWLLGTLDGTFELEMITKVVDLIVITVVTDFGTDDEWTMTGE